MLALCLLILPKDEVYFISRAAFRLESGEHLTKLECLVVLCRALLHPQLGVHLLFEISNADTSFTLKCRVDVRCRH